MNLILLHPDECSPGPEGTLLATLQDRRADHILAVHRAAEGDSLRVGLLNGAIGTASVVAVDKPQVRLSLTLTQEPPPALPLKLVLALPRPKMLKRIIQHATAMGVKELYLVNAYRVEKSFWQTPWLDEERLREQALLGLEQSVDTVMPRIELRKRFKPFVEDELPQICADTRKLVAHPGTPTPCPVDVREPVTIAIGPEGGFIPYEVEKLQAQGFSPVHLGRRILRVETAVPVLLSRLFPAV